MPHNDNWAVKKPNAKRVSSTHRTQKEAQNAATAQAKKVGNTEVFTHRKDGTIREKNTYHRKDDPRKTKG